MLLLRLRIMITRRSELTGPEFLRHEPDMPDLSHHPVAGAAAHATVPSFADSHRRHGARTFSASQ